MWLVVGIVPNAPCGVESSNVLWKLFTVATVPNAPCGVESLLLGSFPQTPRKFLMHRVELKVELDKLPQFQKLCS